MKEHKIKQDITAGRTILSFGSRKKQGVKWARKRPVPVKDFRCGWPATIAADLSQLKHHKEDNLREET